MSEPAETPIKLKKFQHSTTKRKDLKNCPLQFYHRHVAKTYPFTETPAILIGKLCDTVLEDSIISGQDPDLDKLRADIHRIDPEYRYLDDLVAGTDAAYEYAVSRTGVKIAQLRLALSAQFKPTPIDWKQSSKLFDSSMPDLMTISDDSLFIDDWKTGNPNFPHWDQLADYALYGFANIPTLQEAVCSIVWLRKGRHDEEIVHKDTKVFQRQEVVDTVKRWRDHHEEVKERNASGEWTAKPNNMCSYCDHFNNYERDCE